MHIELQNIRKQFDGAYAIDGVNLTLQSGEIHALLGENGAGKTTLMNVLYGMVMPDSGAIRIDQTVHRFQSPQDAIRLGIGMIHQHFALVPTMTVLENLMLGEKRPDRWRLNHRQASEELRLFSQQQGLEVDPNAVIQQLSVGTQQRVEILKALRHGAKTLILDEPTAVLTPLEVEEFFLIMTRFRQAGHTIVFITHKLHEAMAISDRITVLRYGQVAGSMETSSASLPELTRLMIGRETNQPNEKSPISSSHTALTIDHINIEDDRGQQAVQNLSLHVKSGEIIGVAGVDGNGQKELAEALCGLRNISSGTIKIGTQDTTGLSVLETSRLGLSQIPQDRHTTGLILNFSVEENLILSEDRLKKFSRFGFLDFQRIRTDTHRLIKQFDIRARDAEIPVSTLSGGNQQKLIFARTLAEPKDILVVFNPTRGVDINASEEIYQELLARRSAGTAILLISTELDEIFLLSDRIAIMFEGRMVGLVSPDTSREKIGSLMAGAA
jgi:ABC-type uncharacterized transport system ATPase subunit